MGLGFHLNGVEAEENTLGLKISYLNMDRTLKFVGLSCYHPHNVTIHLSHLDKLSRIHVF